jgi:hypothetical protein
MVLFALGSGTWVLPPSQAEPPVPLTRPGPDGSPDRDLLVIAA